MNTIAIIQIVIAVALIALILLQQRDSDLSGFLGGGGGGGGGFYQQRRGLERLFFTLTIILTVAFAALALTSLLYQPAPIEPAPETTTNASSTVPTASTTPANSQ